MYFENREDAGLKLANVLSKLQLKPKQSLVIAILRGGIVVAFEISKKLKIPLSALVVRKIGAPFQRELAIGAVTSFSNPALDKETISDLGVSSKYLKQETRRMQLEAVNREGLLGISNVNLDVLGKTLVVVDDGLATGASAICAARALKEKGAKRLILAVPCGAPSALLRVREYFDRVVCPVESEEFFAVGQFYRDFSAVEDDDVVKILASSALIGDN